MKSIFFILVGVILVSCSKVELQTTDLPKTIVNLNINIKPDTSYGAVSVSTNNLLKGSTIQIKAIPKTGIKFQKWTYDLNDSINPHDLLLDTSKIITANFVKEIVPESQLKFSFSNPDYLYIGYYNRKRYFLSKNRTNWINAYIATLKMPNISLASVENSNVSKFLMDSTAKVLPNVNGYTGEQWVFIGLKYNKIQKRFQWINGSNYTYTNWLSGHPEAGFDVNNINIGAQIAVNTGAWLETFDLAIWWYIIEEIAVNENIPVVNTNLPTAYFEYSNNSNCNILPTEIVFNNYTSNAASYFWDFGDGQNSTLSTPTHIFNSSGKYKVVLKATNSFGIDSFYSYVNFICPINYTSFQNKQYKLYPTEGRNMAILSQKDNLDPSVLKTWLNYFDLAYDYYFNITGKRPTNSTNYLYNNKPTIADVSATCGAGCGNIGSTGIEYLNVFFEQDYQILKEMNKVNHIPFYEMGRNFWTYSSKLTYSGFDTPPITGFAVYNRFKSMEFANLNPANFDGIEFSIFKNNVINMADIFINNPALSFDNTFLLNNGFKSGIQNLSAADLFASFCFKLEALYGASFVNNIWKEVDKRPDAISIQSAIDNFVLSACAVANTNISSKFIQWKWPVSQTAINEAKIKWP